MNFDLTEDQKLVQEAVADMAQTEIAPLAAQADLDHQLSKKVLEQLTAMELWGGPFDPKWGGAGLDYLSYVLVIEELSRACASTGVLVAAHCSLACSPIATFGSDPQKERFLAPMVKGEKIGSFLLTEAGAGSDVAALSSKCVDRGDHFEVSGSKQFITNGGYLGYGVLFATTDRALGAKGINAFLVDLSDKAVCLTKNEDKLGIRGSYTSAFSFDGLKIPKDQLLGEPGEGFHIAMETLNGGRISIAAQAIGIGQAALDMAVAYSQERVQFGRSIGRFGAIQEKLADMSSQLEAARLITYKAAWAKDQGKLTPKDSATAKLLASKAATFCADQCLQIHGGYGYITESGVERLFRDARITEIYEGTSEIQKIVIAKALSHS